MISPSVIASLVFGACGMLAAATVEYLLRSIADEAGVNRLIFIAVPALFSMLYAMLVYQDSERKVRRIGESVSRGVLIALLTWLSFAALVTWAVCPLHQLGSCFSHTLIASAIIGGGPMLAAALLAGVLTGLLIIRPPTSRRAE